MISFDRESRVFRLDTPNSSYAMAFDIRGHLHHLYYGKRVSDCANLARLAVYRDRSSFSGAYHDESRSCEDAQGTLLQEFGSFQSLDFRYSSGIVRTADGVRYTEPVYLTHRIYNGKPVLAELPHSFATAENPAETLEITLRDRRNQVDFILSYTVFANSDVIVRSAKAVNLGTETVKLERLASFSFDIACGDYELLQLSGEYSRERQVRRQKLAPGMLSFGSRRMSSSHHHNPAMALVESGANEDSGSVIGAVLVYSGSFEALAEVAPSEQIRLAMGVNSEQFEWTLIPGGEFQTPEALLTYSASGLGTMSRSFHDFLRGNLINPRWAQVKRPLLVNNWEATYFNFNREKLLDLARSARDLGIEMLVLDDGWFGARNNDRCSLGDWFVNEEKIGDIKTMVEEINRIGIKFGLWYEPEMISPDSELYRRHPEWALTAPGTEPSLARHQMVLDMANSEVVDYLFDVMSRTLHHANIEYIKWDMNRQVCEYYNAELGPERQGEYAHRYILGVYALYRRLLAEFPDLLIEGCSGGGGRFDAGIMAYAPQSWGSDDSDAIERLSIQHGSAMFYPASTIGAHVSVCPNHQTGRTTPLETRVNVALAGTFGYELDLTRLSEAECKTIVESNKFFHSINHLVLSGDYYRLQEFDRLRRHSAAWSFVSKDASEALAVYVVDRRRTQEPTRYLKLKGLNPDVVYVEETDKTEFFGDTLMNVGLPLPELPDGASLRWHFKQK